MLMKFTISTIVSLCSDKKSQVEVFVGGHSLIHGTLMVSILWSFMLSILNDFLICF
jgi:hypothetical protein